MSSNSTKHRGYNEVNRGKRVNVATTPTSRTKGPTPLEILMGWFASITGSPNRPAGKKSECAENLHKLAKKFPGHEEKIEHLARHVELEDALPDAANLGKKLKERVEEQSRTIKSRDSNIKELGEKEAILRGKNIEQEKTIKEEVTRRQRIGVAISDMNDPTCRETLPIRWGQSLDTIRKELPEMAEIMGKSGLLGRLMPRDYSEDVCVLETIEDFHENEGGFYDSRVTYFLAAKQERGKACESEDRVGFLKHDRGYRAVALDGVGGSMHPRQLVREIGERSLGADDFIDSVRETLEVVGESMTEDKVRMVADSKLEFFQKKRLAGGAACVLAAVDYNEKKRKATVHQIGDTVAFVERKNGVWSIFPRELSDGKSFDSRPEQLNCKIPSGASKIVTSEVNNATGRIALATDGVAEHILSRGGIKEFIGRIRSTGEDGAVAFLGELRKEGIADDDLSFLLIDKN